MLEKEKLSLKGTQGQIMFVSISESPGETLFLGSLVPPVLSVLGEHGLATQ